MKKDALSISTNLYMKHPMLHSLLTGMGLGLIACIGFKFLEVSIEGRDIGIIANEMPKKFKVSEDGKTFTLIEKEEK